MSVTDAQGDTAFSFDWFLLIVLINNLWNRLFLNYQFHLALIEAVLINNWSSFNLIYTMEKFTCLPSIKTSQLTFINVISR